MKEKWNNNYGYLTVHIYTNAVLQDENNCTYQIIIIIINKIIKM